MDCDAIRAFFKEGWTIKHTAVSKVIKWGIQAVGELTCLKKISACVVISLAIYLHCNDFKTPSNAALICLLFLKSTFLK